MVKVTTKWNKPLEFEYIWHLDKLKRRLEDKITTVFDKTTGALAASFTFKPVSRSAVELRSGLPYAAAHEFGADIPERVPVNAAALRWEGAGGIVFAKYASAFKLRERPYARPSLEEWATKDVSVRWIGDK